MNKRIKHIALGALFYVAYSLVVFKAFAAENVIVHLRNHGYTMGDLIEVRANIRLPHGAQIDAESLPLAGRIKPWLDLREVRLEQHGDEAHLYLTWQMFGTVEIAQPLKTPELMIKTQGKPPATLVIPAQEFYYSPIFGAQVGEIVRRPDLPPFKFDTHTPALAAALSAALGLTLGLVWLWLQDKIPWLPRRPGPLTQLARMLKSAPAAHLSVAQMTAVHHALNQSAAQTLYPGTLGALFVRAPYLKPHEAAISNFFQHAWRAFYGRSGIQTIEISHEETLAWVKQAALAERVFWRGSAI
jgi:mxaA protein